MCVRVNAYVYICVCLCESVYNWYACMRVSEIACTIVCRKPSVSPQLSFETQHRMHITPKGGGREREREEKK